MGGKLTYKTVVLLLLMAFLSVISSHAFAQQMPQDTITAVAIIYEGDTIEAKTLQPLLVHTHYSEAQRAARAKWTRLRNAIYVTYPYAKRAGGIMNELNARLQKLQNPTERKTCIKSREKELKKEFTEPLTNLSIYQGRVLMKLINRETGNNCYDIIKEYKGALTARLYQTVAFFFSSNLKQPYDRNGEDVEMEKIVQEVERMYGFRS